MGSILHIKREKQPGDGIFRIYSNTLHEVKLAKMAMGNEVGFEIFQFIHPKVEARQESFEHHKTGFFHI